MDVVIPLEATGRAYRAMAVDRIADRDEDAIIGRSIAADGLDMLLMKLMIEVAMTKWNRETIIR
jgi:hypothetical protein